MKILVASCDKNNDLFYPFYHCMEKYGPNHPEIFYSTETIINPYYKTICKNYPLSSGSRRIRDSASEINGDYILLMCDDIFLRKPVKEEILYSLENILKDNIAACNLTYRFDKNDIQTNISYICKRSKDGEYKTANMCQLFQKEKLLELFDFDLDPGQHELANIHKGYEYLILNDTSIINGYGDKPLRGLVGGIHHGKGGWDCLNFLQSEGIEIDINKRGVDNTNLGYINV